MHSAHRWLSVGLFVSVVAVGISGCDRPCVSCDPTAPTTQECSYTVTPASQHFPYLGGVGNVLVSTQSGCTWAVASDTAWLSFTSTTGNTASYSVHANPGGARAGTLVVAGKAVAITQDGAPVVPPPPQPTPPPPQPTPPPSCSFAVQESPQQFTYQGGNGGFSVSASRSDCAWTAVSRVGWIAITGGSPGTGNGTVTYLVAGNAGPSRTGTIAVAGKSVTVIQSAP